MGLEILCACPVFIQVYPTCAVAWEPRLCVQPYAVVLPQDLYFMAKMDAISNAFVCLPDSASLEMLENCRKGSFLLPEAEVYRACDVCEAVLY